MEKEENKKIYKNWWFWIIIFTLLCSISVLTNSSQNININSTTNNTLSNITDNNNKIKLQHGDLLDFMEDTNIDNNTYYCVIKAKIEPSYNNKTTISQNFFSMEDFIKNQNGNKYDEIQYWAVADMQSGNESKVISFTLNKDIINKIYNSEIPINRLNDYLSDIWILPSLNN